jgi:hypothetical protein
MVRPHSVHASFVVIPLFSYLIMVIQHTLGIKDTRVNIIRNRVQGVNYKESIREQTPL